MSRLITATLAVALLLLAVPVEAGTIPFDSAFVHDTTVGPILPPYTKAVFKQDPNTNPVALYNDPSAGHPVVIVGGVGRTLLFDYDLYELSSGNNETFWASLTDAINGLPVTQPGYEFTAAMSSAGTVAWDLSPFAGKTLGIRFEMRSAPNDPVTSASLIVENLRIVPLPAAALPGLGLLCLLLILRLRRRN